MPWFAAWQKFVNIVTSHEVKTQQFKITLVHPYQSECTIYIALTYKSLSCIIANVREAKNVLGRLISSSWKRLDINFF